jgi:hypothetical protein
MFVCPFCKHTGIDKTRCAAFPDGIPTEIKLTRVNHRKPVEGDHGIRFEPDGAMPDWINQVWPA